jgi:hypothetical protein
MKSVKSMGAVFLLTAALTANCFGAEANPISDPMGMRDARLSIWNSRTLESERSREKNVDWRLAESWRGAGLERDHLELEVATMGYFISNLPDGDNAYYVLASAIYDGLWERYGDKLDLLLADLRGLPEGGRNIPYPYGKTLDETVRSIMTSGPVKEDVLEKMKTNVFEVCSPCDPILSALSSRDSGFHESPLLTHDGKALESPAHAVAEKLTSKNVYFPSKKGSGDGRRRISLHDWESKVKQRVSLFFGEGATCRELSVQVGLYGRIKEARQKVREWNVGERLATDGGVRESIAPTYYGVTEDGDLAHHVGDLLQKWNGVHVGHPLTPLHAITNASVPPLWLGFLEDGFYISPQTLQGFLSIPSRDDPYYKAAAKILLWVFNQNWPEIMTHSAHFTVPYPDGITLSHFAVQQPPSFVAEGLIESFLKNAVHKGHIPDRYLKPIETLKAETIQAMLPTSIGTKEEIYRNILELNAREDLTTRESERGEGGGSHVVLTGGDIYSM